jgi:hypothetical protein
MAKETSIKRSQYKPRLLVAEETLFRSGFNLITPFHAVQNVE